MVRSVWVDKVRGLTADGQIVCVTIVSDGEFLVLRGKRSTAIEGLAICQRDYAALEAAERSAKVLAFKRRGRKH